MNETISDEYDDYDVIRNETNQHAASLNRVSKIFDNVELSIVCFGLVANSIGLITLLKSRHTSTPSFVYHKALGSANLTYCLNFILVKILRQYASYQRYHYAGAFPNYATCFYMGVISRALSSTCGYFVMYMSLLIIADRFLALVLFAKYDRFNKMSIAIALVLASLILSVAAHSWAPWLENLVKKIDLFLPTDDELEILDDDHSEQTRRASITAYTIVARDRALALKTALSIKDSYNLVIRLAYAMAQTALTVCVVRAFHAQKRKSRTLKATRTRASDAQNGIGARERSLSYLMLAVAFLSCTQVLPREFKRVFDLLCPIDIILPSINDRSIDVGVRRKYMLLAVYGHGYWKLIANVLTAIERSILFYLYFILNYHFREEVISLIKCRCDRRRDYESIDVGRRVRSLSLPTPNIRFRFNDAKTSTHLATVDASSISNGLWINRSLSACIVTLVNRPEPTNGADLVAV